VDGRKFHYTAAGCAPAQSKGNSSALLRNQPGVLLALFS